jgi:hypothetical protein
VPGSVIYTLTPYTPTIAGTTFNTPSAFSVHVKRIITPGKQGDDGWHSVYVEGVLLNAIRQQYHAKMLGQPYKQSSNKTPRRNQSSPRQQQQQALSNQQPQQPAQPQQQQLGQRPPLPMPKLKLGNIKGLPQQHSLQQQQEPQRVLQPAQQQDPGQGQAQQPKPKLKFKMPLKLAGSSAAGAAGAPGLGAQQQAAAGAAAGAGAGVGVHQALAAPVVLQCPVDPHQPMLQVGWLQGVLWAAGINAVLCGVSLQFLQLQLQTVTDSNRLQNMRIGALGAACSSQLVGNLGACNA